MIVFSLITLIVYPLNILFLGSAFSNQDVRSDVKIEVPAAYETEPVSKVEGAADQKEDLFSLHSFVPVRKPNSSDLIIPNAHASIVIDAGTGNILHYHNGKERKPIASLTKIMTAVIVVENIENLEEAATVDKESLSVEGTKVGCPRSGYCISTRLVAGEKISILNLLKAMLMNSANDAAVILAKHVAGTEEEFVKLMNDKAKKLELNDSVFCNASGLDDETKNGQCFSSAYDIARIAAYSMKHDIIWEILRQPNTTIASIDGSLTHNVINTDRALGQIPNCLGGKTGFTPAAGHSLLMAAGDNSQKHKIIAVVLDDPYRWSDIEKMIKWAFENHEWK